MRATAIRSTNHPRNDRHRRGRPLGTVVTTAKALAAELGIDQKTLVAWLRVRYPRAAEETLSRAQWQITPEMVAAAHAHFGRF